MSQVWRKRQKDDKMAKTCQKYSNSVKKNMKRMSKMLTNGQTYKGYIRNVSKYHTNFKNISK